MLNMGHTLDKVKGKGGEQTDFICTTLGDDEKKRRNNLYIKE